MPRPDRRPKRTYMAHVVPGLEPVAEQELAQRLSDTSLERVLRRFDERTSLLIFQSGSPPGEMLQLRTVEDVFVLAALSESVPGARSGLAAVRSLLLSSPDLDEAVSAARGARRPRKGKPSFRVVARAAGKHEFRRVDLQRTAARAVLERYPGWRLVEDGAQLELWVQLVGSVLVAGVRLSDITMRGRTYRRVSLPAALKPTVAHAMALLSDPSADDVVLDPMCGSGTILIERALAGRYRLLLGGDRDPAAVRATCDNVGPRYKPIEIRTWDARRLPLKDGSVSTLLTNMPFGRRIGSHKENESLYPALLAEWSRVVEAGGRLVLLTGEGRLLGRALKARPELEPVRQLPVLVRGYPSTIFLLRKRQVPRSEGRTEPADHSVQLA